MLRNSGQYGVGYLEGGGGGGTGYTMMPTLMDGIVRCRWEGNGG